MTFLQLKISVIILLFLSVAFSVDEIPKRYIADCAESGCEIPITEAGTFESVVKVTVKLTEVLSTKNAKSGVIKTIWEPSKQTFVGKSPLTIAKKILFEGADLKSITYLGVEANSPNDDKFLKTEPKSIPLKDNTLESTPVTVLNTFTKATQLGENNEPLSSPEIPKCGAAPSVELCIEEDKTPTEFSAVYFKGDTAELPESFTFKNGDTDFTITLTNSSPTKIFAWGLLPVLVHILY